MLSTVLILLAAAQAPAAEPPPIVVTAHGGVPFISPMGEPIRARMPNEDTLARWFNRADLNRDGVLTPVELQADAERYFAVLDTNQDGQIDPDELVHYEWQVAPEIQVAARFRRARTAGDEPDRAKPRNGDQDESTRRSDREMDFGPQGAGRYALLNMPEPVAAADADLNRAVTLQEFRQAALDRFQLLDKRHAGSVTLAELEAMKPVVQVGGRRQKRRADEPDARIGVPLPPGD
jgi:Ca2+-binding EF-hand superfamily protein